MNRITHRRLMREVVLVCLCAALFSASARAGDLNGSTFAAPVYGQWAVAYQKSGGKKVSYQAVGSSAGIQQILANTVDFAGSDAPLSNEELAKRGLMQFPTVMGGVVPVVNIPGIKPGQLTLSGPLLGDIYLGKITNWSDPAIAALNPGISLPDLDIAVIRRSDGSGTSLIWTHYLAQVNPEWRTRIGEGTSVHWPHGMAAKDNNGVAVYVQHLPGAIGYVAWDFVKQNHLIYTAMKNAAGFVVQPGVTSFKAAAAGANWFESLDQIPTNEAAADAWPVVGATFALLHASESQAGQNQDALKFFDWALSNGDPIAASLGYVPLPQPVMAAVRSQWWKVQAASNKLTP
jgi:phosphate transport system substrate-binding protein